MRKNKLLVLVLSLLVAGAFIVPVAAEGSVVPANRITRPYVFFNTSSEENWGGVWSYIYTTDTYSEITGGQRFICGCGFGTMGTTQASYNPTGITKRISYNSTFPFIRNAGFLFAMYDYSLGSDHYYSTATWNGSSCDRIVVDNVTWEDGKMVFYVKLFEYNTMHFYSVTPEIESALRTNTGYRGIRWCEFGTPRGSMTTYTAADGIVGLRISDNELPGMYALGQFAIMFNYVAVNSRPTGVYSLQSAYTMYWYSGFGVTITSDTQNFEYGAYSIFQFSNWFALNFQFVFGIVLAFWFSVFVGKCIVGRFKNGEK